MIEPVPTPEHERFDSLCQNLEEYDALPATLSPGSERPPQDRYELEHPDERLDGQILAALISP